MLGDAGSVASIVGVAISLLGLGFAILQIIKLRGETRAIKEATEATRRAIGRELTSTELTRLDGRINTLKELHRNKERERCLVVYPEIRGLLLEIRRRHPGLSDQEKANVSRAIAQIAEMERVIDMLQDEMTSETVGEFNSELTGLQTDLLIRLEDQLQ